MDLTSAEKNHLWYRARRWVKRQEKAIMGKRL
jgi:hypothetical protein